MTLAILLVAAPAMAHSDTGNMAVEVAGGDDSLHPRVSARVTYANDGEPAPAATVNVEAVAADGTVGATAALNPEGDGVYAAAIALPSHGAWTVRATATNPAATGEAGYVAEAPAATTRPATTDPAATALAGQEERADGGARDTDTGGGGTAAGRVVVFITALALVAGLVALLFVRRFGNTSTS